MTTVHRSLRAGAMRCLRLSRPEHTFSAPPPPPPPPLTRAKSRSSPEFVLNSGFFTRLFLLAAVFLLLSAPPAFAQSTITVNATCSFADAITAANTDTATNGCPAGSGADTIVLTRKVELSDHSPDITGTLTIDGRGRTIDGMEKYRAITIQTTGADVTIRDITITRGSTATISHSQAAGAAIRLSLPSSPDTQNASLTLNRVRLINNASRTNGGALTCTYANLSISDSVFANNTAEGNGGGLNLGIRCAATIKRSAIHGNTANTQGGGIVTYNGTQSILIVNSTIYNNTATRNEGGGIMLSGDVYDAPIELRHLTITGNHVAGGRYKAAGIMVRVSNSAVNLRNSIIWGNTGSEQCGTSKTGGVNVYTNNIVQAHADDNCGAASNDDPRLPSNPTGSVPYFPLPENSPAVGAAGDCSALTTEDQRGYSRPYPVNGFCDVGAYEWHAPPAAPASAEESGGDESDDSAEPEDKPSSCESLPANIEVKPQTDATECRVVSAAGIGHPDVAAAKPAAVVDVWGWVKPDTEVCFEASSGSIQFIDTEAMPRTVTTLPSSNGGGMTCATIAGAGQVALIADGSSPQVQAQAPAAEQAAEPAPAEPAAPACTAEAQSNEAREDGSRVHIVQAGECLWMIAVAYNLSFGELTRLNGMEWNASMPPIQPGEEIIVGAASE